MNQSRGVALLAFLLAAMFIFAELGKLPLLDPDEGRNAEIAEEMQASRAWFVPTYDGLVYLDKPAFYFRNVAISFAIFGVSERSARLPSAFYGFALLVLLYFFCRRAYNARTAALAVMVLGTTPLYFAFSRLVIFDMALTFWACVAIFAAYIAEEKEGRARQWWYLGGAIAAAIATLVKGPVGFILPVLVLLVLDRVDGRRGVWKRILAPWNLIVFFSIALAWFVALSIRRPDFPYYGLVEESFRRFTTSSFHRTAPVYYFLVVIAVFFFPWSTLLPESVGAAWRTRGKWNRGDRLFVVYAVVVVVFFSISKSKLPGYVLPGVVALGVLVARVFDLALVGSDNRAARLVLRGVFVLGGVSVALAALLSIQVFHLASLPNLLHIRSREFARAGILFPAAMWTFIAIGVGAFLAGLVRNVRAVLATYVLFPVILMTAGFSGLCAYAEASSSRALARSIPALPRGTQVACLECFAAGLPFYLHRRIVVISRDGHEITSNYLVYRLQKGQPWPSGVVPWPKRFEWLSSLDHPAYILARQPERAALESFVTGRGGVVSEILPGWWGVLVDVRGGR